MNTLILKSLNYLDLNDWFGFWNLTFVIKFNYTTLLKINYSKHF